MKITKNGMMFEDEYELAYELLQTLDIKVNPDGTLLEKDTNTIIYFNGMKVKATIDKNDIKYTGEGEISFDVLGNVRLITTLFGHYLDKKQAEGMKFLSYFPTEKISEIEFGKGREKHTEDVKYTNITLKHDSANSISSKFYHNKNLKFIDIIFALEDDNVDLSNFDIITEENLK